MENRIGKIKIGTAAILLFLHQFTFAQSDSNKSISSALKEWNKRFLQSAGPRTFENATITANGVSVPSDFPRIAITINDNPDTGYIFLNNRFGQPYTMILDNAGLPVWYWRTPYTQRNFKVEDNGMLTMIVRASYGKPDVFDGNKNMGYIVLNQNYAIVDSIHAANGYWIDEHDLKMLEDGSYFLIACYDSSGIDMSQYVNGGQTDATVHWSMIQEFDPSGTLVHQWSPWDLFTIDDMVGQGQNLRAGTIYFPHMNAVDIDLDGHILLSSRYLNEVTKINRHTGEIIWRLGGKNNQFNFIGDDLNGFSWQHDINVLENGHYTVFDNGNRHSPPLSRAVEYELDTLNMKATLIWEYRNPHGSYSSYMGNAQRLHNGNTVINWANGSLPILTEVRQNSEVAFEMWYQDGLQCYRTYRFPWNGKALKPYLIVESHKEAVVLIYNEFGDPNVDYYKIYGGTSPNPATLIDTSKVTLKTLTNLQNQQQYYFRVASVDIFGNESDYSNEENCYTNFIEPGTNMALNGDFSNEKTNWYFFDENPASANWSVEDGICHVNIAQGGNDAALIALVQDGMEVIRGEQYLFEFDAWSDAQRTVEAMILQNGESYINYSKTGTISLTTGQTHYTFSFVMEDPSDLNALVIFFMGNSDVNVHIDNISFKRIIESEVSRTPDQTPHQYELRGNYPNPFNAQTNICFSVPAKNRVRIQLYNILGKFEDEICDAVYEQGDHQIQFDGSRLGSGIYFYTMKAEGIQYPETFRDVHKMILIK